MRENKDLAIKVEGLYKQYRLGTIGADTLKDDIKLGIAMPIMPMNVSP